MDVTTAQAWRGFECLKCSVCLQWFSGLICSVEAEVWAGNVNKPLWSIKDLWIFPPPRFICRWAVSKVAEWGTKWFGRFFFFYSVVKTFLPTAFTREQAWGAVSSVLQDEDIQEETFRFHDADWLLSCAAVRALELLNVVFSDWQLI